MTDPRTLENFLRLLALFCAAILVLEESKGEKK